MSSISNGCEVVINKYLTDIQKWENDKISKQKWENLHNQWKNKTGNYSRWNDILNSENDTFKIGLDWNNCNSISDNRDTNWQCGNQASRDGKYDPWGYYAYEDYYMRGAWPCVWRGINCKRRDSSKNKIRNEYLQNEPTTDLSDPNSRQWIYNGIPVNLESERPKLPDTLVCCGINIDNITSNEILIDNINQKCSATDNNTTESNTNNTTIPTNNTTIPTNNTNNTIPTNNTTNTTENNPTTDTNNTIIISLIIVFVLIFLFVLFISSMSFLMK